MRFCPYAQVNDGLLDVVIGRTDKRGEMLKVLDVAKKGAHIYHPALNYYRG
jgi:diacylglycerol kinase family enzyme